ncbi:MAG TPA: hypothetical protein VKU90_07895 [Caulobacteraceae bacterium]|nr:hypothetical protein [Caulobacteraceae bacterium]
MVKLRFAALAMSVLFAATATRADDANFAAFHRICIAAGGVRAAALAAAEAQGFVRPPKVVLDQINEQSVVPLNNADVRAKLIENGIEWVSVGAMNGAFQNRYTSTEICVLGVNPMSPATEKAAIAWGGVAPAVSDPQYQMLLFTGGEGAHRAVPTPDTTTLDTKTLSAVASTAKLQLLGAGHTEGVTLMLYGIVTAAPAGSPPP